MGQYWHTSILARLLISLFAIVIPLYTISFLLNDLGAKTNMREAERNMKRSAYSFHRLIEAEVQQISKMMSESAIKIALVEVEKTPASSSSIGSMDVLEIQGIVQDIQWSSRLVKNTTVFLPSYNASVTINSFSSIMDVEAYEHFSRAPTDKLTSWRNGLYLVYPYLTHSKPEGSFVVAVEINEPSLRLLMRDVNGYEHGGAILFKLENNWLLGSELRTGLYEEFINEYIGSLSNESNSTGSITTNATQYFVSADTSAVLGTTMLVYTPKETIQKPMESYRKFFRWMLILSFVIIVGVSIWIYRTVHSPLRTLVKTLREIERENMDPPSRVGSDYKDEFGYIYHRINITISKLKESIHNGYIKEINSQRAELKRLQSQINPHFLYNTFFVLSRLIRREEIEAATQFAQYLGQYFQFITRDGEDVIPLSKEIEHLKAFAEIQMICYPQVEVMFQDLPDETITKEVLVPRLILQPILENCYKHGFQHSYTNGKVSVTGEITERYLLFHFEDNGDGINDEQIAELQMNVLAGGEGNSGLWNVHKRVHLHFKGDSGLTFERGSLGGLRVTIKMLTAKGVEESEPNYEPNDYR